MAIIDLQDLLGIEPQEDSCSYIKTSKHEILSHQVFIDKKIGEPSNYRDLISMLNVANENTEFNFLINTPGGSMSSTMAIIEAIKGTEATVRAIITGECSSGGSILALHCHEIVVTDSAHMLVHTAQYGTRGFTANVKSHADFSVIYVNKIIDETYSGFLTDVELANVKAGVEYWYTADEIITRLNNKQKYKEAQAKKSVSKTKKTATSKV